jgi:uncharacterized protein YkwD
MNTVLAEADAALANPALGDDARRIVELFKLINQARASSGLYPLRMDARLAASAQDHAANMSHARYCRHTGLDGSNAKGRIRSYGYGHNNWAGENILCSRWTPQDAMDWWLNSGPHRRNILHGHFTHIGIGYDPAGQYGPSWVLNFAAGAGETIGVSYMPASGSISN